MKELSLLCVVLFTYSTSCLGQSCVLRLVLINVSLSVSIRVPKCIPFGSVSTDWIGWIVAVVVVVLLLECIPGTALCWVFGRARKTGNEVCIRIRYHYVNHARGWVYSGYSAWESLVLLDRLYNSHIGMCSLI